MYNGVVVKRLQNKSTELPALPFRFAPSNYRITITTIEDDR